jgi:hypothetical protein
MQSPWLSLCFIILPAASCGYPDLPNLAGDGGGAACYGTTPFQICLAAVPMAPQPIDMSMSPLNTDTSPLCRPTLSGGDGYCVIAGTDVTVEAKLRAIGHQPLVLIASNSITITGGIDVGSHRTEAGAGADPMDCTPPVGAPTTQNNTGGGGAGGSFIGYGGDGGDGGGSGAMGGRPAPVAVAPMTAIRGGCQGQDGARTSPGTGGHGGGAVFLIALARIEVNGDIIAGGEGGSGGVNGNSGGGGGGAGGMIGFEAPSIHVVGQLVANGGGGGEGAGTGSGDPGDDSTSTRPACGGTGDTLNAGDGCAGSVGSDAQSGDCQGAIDCPLPKKGNTGQAGGSGNSGGGGGGGGGGAGLIKAPASADLGAQVSPPATP